MLLPQGRLSEIPVLRGFALSHFIPVYPISLLISFTGFILL